MNPIDTTLLAAERLEAALERLAEVLEARLAEQSEHVPAASGDMVPRAEVERLAQRLDDALARLRAMLGEEAGLEN